MQYTKSTRNRCHTYHVIRRKRRVCIEHDAFDSKLDVSVTNFARDNGGYGYDADGNGYANVVVVIFVAYRIYVYRQHRVLSENLTKCMNHNCSSLHVLNG